MSDELIKPEVAEHPHHFVFAKRVKTDDEEYELWICASPGCDEQQKRAP